MLSDVDEEVAEVAGWITPRLGGVGPMTRAMLLENAVRCRGATTVSAVHEESRSGPGARFEVLDDRGPTPRSSA